MPIYLNLIDLLAEPIYIPAPQPIVIPAPNILTIQNHPMEKTYSQDLPQGKLINHKIKFI